jgi:hypothetical protein
MGADIFCVVCGGRAYPALGPTGTREDFDLMSLDRDGRPAGSQAQANGSARGISSASVVAVGSRPNGSRQTRTPHPARPRHDRTLESRSQ